MSIKIIICNVVRDYVSLAKCSCRLCSRIQDFTTWKANCVAGQLSGANDGFPLDEQVFLESSKRATSIASLGLSCHVVVVVVHR